MNSRRIIKAWNMFPILGRSLEPYQHQCGSGRIAGILYFSQSSAVGARERHEEHNFNQAGGIAHVMYPQYEHKSTQDFAKEAMAAQLNVITIPPRLKKRLDKMQFVNSTRGATRQRIIDASRKGSKSKVVVACKHSEINHYFGQSFGRGEVIPLASKGWGHREAASAHDYFSIQPYQTNYALLDKEAPISFTDLGLSQDVTDLLTKNNVIKPTVIQSVAIPSLLKGHHCLLASETGSGKTLAYLLPMFEVLVGRKKDRTLYHGLNAPLMLVLLPTRELADQVYNVARSYCADLGLDVKLLQGGGLGSKIASPPAGQKIDVMISTVNVIAQLSRAKVYELDRIETVVLDEADSLLDDSFSPDVIRLLKKFSFIKAESARVQLTLVSATMPRSIHTILDGVFPVEEFEKITTPGLHRVMSHVPQKFIRLKKSEKPEKVLQIAKDSMAKKSPLMIFCNKSETCAWLTMYLLDNNISCVGLSASLSISQRAGRIDKFKNGEVDILVCTDLASRGIDTLNTKHVLNYDFPFYLADYIHRCGRTGRVGGTKSGKVTNFIARLHEVNLVQKIEKSVRQQTSIANVNANIKRLLNVRLGGMGSEDSILG